MTKWLVTRKLIECKWVNGENRDEAINKAFDDNKGWGTIEYTHYAQSSESYLKECPCRKHESPIFAPNYCQQADCPYFGSRHCIQPNYP